MKRIISLILSVIMLTSLTAGIDLTAYAGSYDTVGTARQYNIGSSITGYFSKNDTTDFIQFTLAESGRVDFVFSGSSSYDVKILSTDNSSTMWGGYHISYNSNLGMAYKDDLFARLTAGTYYLKVYYGDSNENYTINTSFTSAYESFYENREIRNDIIGTASPISLDTAYSGQVGDNDSVDFYLFTVSDGTYNINIKADDYTYFSIYTTNGNKIESYTATVNSSTGYAEKTESISLSAGTYCLKISRYNDYGAAYTFSITSPHYHAHAYAGTVAPTYTTQGYDIYTCSCGDSYYTNYTPVKVLGKVGIRSAKAKGKKKITVSWKKKSGASGYQIYWSRSKSFKKLAANTIVKGGKTTSYTGKNFTKGKTYYVKVRAYKNVNGQRVYGKWSAVKSVKCK